MAATELIKQLDDENFQEAISSGLTLVDYFAEWCGPCRMLAPVLEEVAENMKGKLVVAKLDIDSAQKTTQTFEVTSVPTLILFKDGKEVERIVGLRDAEALEELANKHL